MKLTFILVSIIGFITPYLLYFSLSFNNETLKLFAINALPYFNFIYFSIVVFMFFIGLKKSFARYAQLIFVPIYIGFIFVNYYFFSKIKIEKIAKKHPQAKIVKIVELKKINGFKLIYKNGPYALIIPYKKKNTNPFNYKKDKRE